MAISNYKGIIDYINNSDNVDQLALAKAYSGLGKAELARSSTNVAMEAFDKAIGYYEAEDSIASRDYADACYQLAENHMKGSDKTIANEYYVMARGAYLASADHAKARMIQSIIDDNFYYTERWYNIKVDIDNWHDVWYNCIDKCEMQGLGGWL